MAVEMENWKVNKIVYKKVNKSVNKIVKKVCDVVIGMRKNRTKW